MQKLNLDEECKEISTDEEGFWRRQLQPEPTYTQRRFDWLFGVILPAVCFFFDPIVFRGDVWGAAMFGAYKPFAYILGFSSIMAMTAWLMWGAKLKWLNPFLAGLFAVGGVVSLAVGIVIFPISLLGLIVLIGALGFTPLFSAVVYLRNSSRAFGAAKPFLNKKLIIYSFAISMLFSAVIPFVTYAEAEKSMNGLKYGDEETIRYQMAKLRYMAPLINFDLLAVDYHRSTDEARTTPRMKAIAEFYKEMTGNNMDESSWVLMD